MFTGCPPKRGHSACPVLVDFAATDAVTVSNAACVAYDGVLGQPYDFPCGAAGPALTLD
jgi:hypothetical protein